LVGPLLVIDDPRRFCWVIDWDEHIVIAGMTLGKKRRRDVGFKRPNVPGTDAEDVLH